MSCPNRRFLEMVGSGPDVGGKLMQVHTGDSEEERVATLLHHLV